MINLFIDVGGGQIIINEMQDAPWSRETSHLIRIRPDREPIMQVVALDYEDPQRFVSEDLADLGIEAELTYTGICG